MSNLLNPLFILICLFASMFSARAEIDQALSGDATTPTPILADTTGMVYIREGWFIMGADDSHKFEKPAHRVWLDGYYMDRYEVTNRAYKRFCDATGRDYPPDPEWGGEYENYFIRKPDYPVVMVTWEDAKAYASWIGKRLPTEAEWEKAARGPEQENLMWKNEGLWGNIADLSLLTVWPKAGHVAGYIDGYPFTSPVGSFLPNGYGLHDMAGNVSEWVSDFFLSDFYRYSPERNPKGPKSGYDRVVRGMAFYNDLKYAYASKRYLFTQTFMLDGIGFRCVRDSIKVRGK